MQLGFSSIDFPLISIETQCQIDDLKNILKAIPYLMNSELTTIGP